MDPRGEQIKWKSEKGTKTPTPPHGSWAGTVGPMGPGPGQKGSWNAQKVLGMTEFTESSFKCLVTSEVTRTQDPHQQMRNEISV